MPVQQFRAVTITSYRATDWIELPDGVQFLAWGNEICPRTQRPHKQAYAYGVKMSHAAWRTRFPGDHIEKMQGSFADNETYCSKAATLLKLGTAPMPNGKSRAFVEVMERIEQGERPTKIARTSAETHGETVARYHRFFGQVHQEVLREKREAVGYRKPTVEVYIGPTGVHKTRRIYERHGFNNVYRPWNNGSKWFDGYRQQPAVLFDDVSASDIMSVTEFLRLTDGYPIDVPVKGGFETFDAIYIYFTSNLALESWWPHADEQHIEAVHRRIDGLFYVEAPVPDSEDIYVSVVSPPDGVQTQVQDGQQEDMVEEAQDV